MSACDQTGLVWRKAARSGESGCIEVAFVDGTVLVRDSKNPAGLVLKVPLLEWYTFLRIVSDDTIE